MTKAVVEGYFKIPYKGQMRFSVKIVEGELVFDKGNHEYHQYFETQPGNTITTYQFGEEPDKDKHLEPMKEDIFNFMNGNEREVIFEPDFTGTLFGQDFAAKGHLRLYRFYQ